MWVGPLSLFYRRLYGVRRGVALGAFFGSFRVVSCSLYRLMALFRTKTGRLGTDFVNRFVNAFAGFVSGAVFSSIDADVRTAVFVLWILIRALRALLPSVRYGDVVLMCLSASNILSTYVHYPEDNSPSYKKFLEKFGGKTAQQLAPYRHMVALGPAPICSAIHAGQSCTSHFITFTFDGIVRSIPLYLPVHLLGFALSSNKKLSTLASNVLRSSLFLSLYCSSAWLVACNMYRHVYTGGVGRWRTATFEWFAGLSVLIERPSRRRELASYCASHALNAYWNIIKREWHVQPRDSVAVLLLAFSFGTLLQHFEQQPNAITTYFFGINSYPISHYNFYENNK